MGCGVNSEMGWDGVWLGSNAPVRYPVWDTEPAASINQLEFSLSELSAWLATQY